MTHIYDWSKLDAGWGLTPNNNPESVGLLRREDGWAIPIEVLESWEPDSPKHAVSPTVDKFRKEAKAQLAKCRVVDNAPLFESIDKMVAETHQSPSHEATHGWRNPPSIYEEDKTNAEK